MQALLYRDVYEQKWVTKTRQEEITVPGYYRVDVVTIAGHWKEQRVYVQGKYEIKPVWFDEYSITRYREVPGHYEIQAVWFDEYYVTKYYWREAHPARGLKAAWIPYQEVVPAGYSDTRVWVDTYTEEYQEIMPAGFKDTRVWIEGKYVTEKIWVPEQKISKRVWVPAEKNFITVEYKELENVWMGREPVYEFVDESQVRLFEVVELIETPAGAPAGEDAIVIRNMLTGEELTTTGRYMGLATKIADNEFVVP